MNIKTTKYDELTKDTWFKFKYKIGIHFSKIQFWVVSIYCLTKKNSIAFDLTAFSFNYSIVMVGLQPAPWLIKEKKTPSSLKKGPFHARPVSEMFWVHKLKSAVFFFSPDTMEIHLVVSVSVFWPHQVFFTYAGNAVIYHSGQHNL